MQHLREQLVYAASVGPYASGEVKNRSTLAVMLGVAPETVQFTWTFGSITFWKTTRCYLATQTALPTERHNPLSSKRAELASEGF
jgi:hypothetical protein